MEMLEFEQLEKIQNTSTSMVLCSRNKLIGDLLVELSLTDRQYEKGLQMMKDNWEHDKELWVEARTKVLEEYREQ